MKLVEGTYALIPSTNFGVFTANGADETRLVRMEATTNDGGWSLILTSVGTFPTRGEALAEVVFCPGCKQVYLHQAEGAHFAAVSHRWGDIPAHMRGMSRLRGDEDHFSSKITDPEVLADRRAEAMGA